MIADAEGLTALGVTLLTVGVNGPDYDLSDAEELCRWRDGHEERRVETCCATAPPPFLLAYSLAPVAPAAADNVCKPSGIEGASALPEKLVTASPPQERDYTTADVEPLSSVNIAALGLRTPRTLTVGTQPGGPPTSCINTTGRYTGYDNELLRAIAAKLGLKVDFVGTEFSGLLAQVASRRFDVGSSSIVATDARRHTVAFTNGYDFGYLSLVVPPGSPINRFSELGAGQRIGVVQGTVEESYVVDTCICSR